MASPKHRIVAKNKETGKSIQIGNTWEAPFPGAFNLQLGAKKYGDQPEVKLVGLTLEVGGKTTKITSETHFLNLFVNEPRKAEGDDSGESDGDDEDDF